ncbi:hypothetical protein FH972_007528 [Carpinus fangiana]|uniref:Uncharacterized protein n=1 Tax=Carpinus fangiana TaxID=176857 RepID=A0A5N6QVY5_9ROSI|nr:hypothetical protein FH972_007528 [Carpinus fangiana]
MDADNGKIQWFTANPSNATSAGPVLLWLMSCSSQDPQTRKDPYMQWTPKLEKFCGLMKLEPLCLAACW